MEYSMDAKVIEKLMEIETKILESFRLLIVFKGVSTDSYNKKLFDNELARLEVLLKKENMLCEQLPKNSEIIKYIYNLVLHNQHNFFDDESISIPVLNRFGNIMVDLSNLLQEQEEDEMLEDMDIYLDDVDKINTRIMIRDNLNKRNIAYLEQLIDYYDDSLTDSLESVQYSIAFAYKNVSDDLSSKSFDMSKLCYFSDTDLAKRLGISIDDYNNLKDDELYNMAQELFFEIMSNILEENNQVKNKLIVIDSLRFRFLLHEMKTPMLYMFNELVSDSIKDIKDEDMLIEQLGNIVDSELNKRSDLPKKSLEDNPIREAVDEKTVINLINLLKIEEKILTVFDKIDFDDINNSENIKILSNLVDIEKEHIKNINVSYKTASVIEEMLTKDMDFFLNPDDEEMMKRKEDLIYDRIHNVIPFFGHLGLSPIQSEKSYACISQNHIISTLKIFEKVIDKTKNVEQKQCLKKLYKDLFFVNGKLTDDFIFINGNYRMIDRFSDSITSQMIGLSDIEYAFDKDEQLYEQAKYVIEEILSFEDKWVDDLSIWALFEFKLSELSDIMVNVSDEHIYALPSIVKENSNYHSPKSKKIIRKIIKK